MAHMLVMADTYTNFHHCFRCFMQHAGDRYKHPWGVKLREIKLYDVIYAEEDEEMLKQDLKHFEYERMYNNEGNMVVKLVQKLLKKFLKIEPVSMANVKPTPFTEAEKVVQPYPKWFCYVKVIGKVKDAHNDKYGEMI